MDSEQERGITIKSEEPELDSGVVGDQIVASELRAALLSAIASENMVVLISGGRISIEENSSKRFVSIGTPSISREEIQKIIEHHSTNRQSQEKHLRLDGFFGAPHRKYNNPNEPYEPFCNRKKKSKKSRRII